MFLCLIIDWCTCLGGLRAGTHQGPNLGQSVFDYIEKHNARAPVFFNFMYTPDTDQPVSYQC